MSLHPPRQLVGGRRAESDGNAAVGTDAYVETLLASRIAADPGAQTPAVTGPAAVATSGMSSSAGRNREALPPRPSVAADLPSLFDPEVRAAAELLRRSLVRFHPSFRFEDALAARLRHAAMQAEAPGDVVPFPAVPPGQPHAPGLEAAASAVLSSRISFQSIWPAERLDLGRALERADLARALSRLEVGRTVEGIDVAGRMERIPRQVLMGGAIASGVSLAGMAFVAWRWGHRSPGPGGPARLEER